MGVGQPSLCGVGVCLPQRGHANVGWGALYRARRAALPGARFARSRAGCVEHGHKRPRQRRALPSRRSLPQRDGWGPGRCAADEQPALLVLWRDRLALSLRRLNRDRGSLDELAAGAGPGELSAAAGALVGAGGWAAPVDGAGDAAAGALCRRICGPQRIATPAPACGGDAGGRHARPGVAATDRHARPSEIPASSRAQRSCYPAKCSA